MGAKFYEKRDKRKKLNPTARAQEPFCVIVWRHGSAGGRDAHFRLAGWSGRLKAVCARVFIRQVRREGNLDPRGRSTSPSTTLRLYTLSFILTCHHPGLCGATGATAGMARAHQARFSDSLPCRSLLFQHGLTLARRSLMAVR